MDFQLTEISVLTALSTELLEQCIRISATAISSWYTAHESLEEFSLSVDRLRLKEQEWRRLLKRYGMTDHQNLRAILDDALLGLQEEEARMSRFKESRLLRWWKGISSLMFPDELNAHIQRVSDAFDDILKHLEEKRINCNLLRRVALHSPSRLAFDLDPKYVPLCSTFSSVVTALQEEDGPEVIVLHGGPGTGKSSLAKYLAIQYQNGPSLLSAQINGDKFPAAAIDQSFFTDGVYFLPCGPQAESIDCHLELLLMLGLLFPNSDQQEERRDSVTQLHEQLREGLRELSALIIFDDVCDAKLIESLLVPGRSRIRRKYLITSQNAHIWRNSRSLGMEDLALRDARRILATHAGFSDKQIPLDLQPIGDTLIKRTGANPLALASLAVTIGEKDRHDEEKWIAVEEDLVVLLEEETLPQHLMYPTTVASSIMLALKSVPAEALELLYLASLCEGPAVPEVIMRTFYCFLNGGPKKFIQWTDYLENSSLVRVQDYQFSWSRVRQKTWSVHSLRQFFIREKRTQDLETLISRLFDAGAEGKISSEEQQAQQDLVTALCAVYGYVGGEMGNDYELVERASERFGISRAELWQRKTFIKELVWCFQSGSKEKRRHDSRRVARKVILQFLRHGNLDEGDLLDLLEVDEDHACSTACWALGALLGTEEGLFFTVEKYKKTLARLLELMDQRSLPLTRETAARALIKLTASKDEERKRQLPQLLSMPICLQTLVKLVGIDTNSYAVRQCAAWLLANLATVEVNKMTIGGLPEAIEALARLTVEDSSRGKEVQFVFGVQTIGHAARALANTAAADLPTIALHIASQPKLLDGLVSSLANKHHSGVRESGARALLTLQTAPENTQLIGARPKVFENLLALLDDDENPETQMLALGALAVLARYEQFKYSITKHFNAKETVVRLLKKSDPELSEAATWAASFLVLTQGSVQLNHKTSAALRGLVFSLRAKNAHVACIAAGTLSTFVSLNDERKKLVLDVPDALESIVTFLVEGKTAKQQATAALLLAHLAEDDEGSRRILSTPHAVDRLVRLLLIEGKASIEPVNNAAVAISTLAKIRERSGSNAQRIVLNHPQLFESFVHLLDLDHVSEDELHRDEISLETRLEHIRSQPMDGVTESLRSNLEQAKSMTGWRFRMDLQLVHHTALCALNTFICHSDEELRTRNAIQILAIRDQAVVRSAVRILNDDGSLEAAKSAAYRLLGSLACPLENKRKIAAHPRLFETLFQTLIHEDGPQKTLGAWALSFLVIFDEGMGCLNTVPGALDNLAEMLLGKFGDTKFPLDFSQSSAAKSLINLTTSRVNKLAFVKSSTALSSLLQFINQEDSPLWIRHQALQVLANVASVGENRHILVSCCSSEWNVMETINDLLTSATGEMMYLAAYTATRLDWDNTCQRNFDSPEALFGRANAGIEMKHFPQALADIRALASSDRKPQLPEPTALPHIWYSSCYFGRVPDWADPFKVPTFWYSCCYTVFCIRVLSAVNGVDQIRSKGSSGRKPKCQASKRSTSLHIELPGLMRSSDATIEMQILEWIGLRPKPK